LEAVLHNEFPPELAEELCQEHQGLAVEVRYQEESSPHHEVVR
jgi:hypothetical protein